MKFFALFWIVLLWFSFGIYTEALTVTEYGPSLELLFSGAGSSDYKKEIHLEVNHPKYSVVIPLANGKATASPRDIHPDGKFTVSAPRGYGVMMVVQTLRLRTKVAFSYVENATVTQCRDFLKFEGNNQSAEVCGFVTKFNKDVQPYGLRGPRTFLTPESQLDVTIHIDDSEPTDLLKEELISLELVFTAFQDCPDTFLSQWNKWTGSSRIKSCSPSDNAVCISSKAFCDSSIACGNPGPLGTIGFDEDNCKQSFSSVATTDGSWGLLRPVTTTTTHRPYIGISTPYNPPTSAYKLNPLEIIGIFVGVVLLLFGTCTWLARANEKKFQHTVYRFSTLRRTRRHTRQHSLDNIESTRIPTAPPPSDTNTIASTATPTAPNAPEIPGEQPPPYHAIFPILPVEIDENGCRTQV